MSTSSSSEASVAALHGELWGTLGVSFEQALTELRAALVAQGFRDLGIDFRYSATRDEARSFVYVIAHDPVSGFPAALGVTLASTLEGGCVVNAVRMQACALDATTGAPCSPVLHSEPLQTLPALPDEACAEAMGSILEASLLRRGLVRLLDHVRH